MSKVNKKFVDLTTGTNGINGQGLIANFTPSNYTPSQVASEGTDKISAHLKGIDNKFATITGSAGDIVETSFSIANNQSSAANVTGLSFANGTVRSFEALVSVYINATSSTYENFKIFGIQRGADWKIDVSSVGDNSGIVFSITNAGQIQYTSTNNAGFSSGTMKFRAITTSV
jgi:hypothetical protein